jgi:catechol 2,3-dioxygenase-like lactoylglutathione lyase family enzyme
MSAIWSQTMLVVSDVEASSAFYCDVLGFESGHGGPDYEQLMHGSELVLQLHHDEVDHDHDRLRLPDVPVGNGVIVWFEVSDFEGTVARAKERHVSVNRDVHENPNAKQREFWFHDPDGYLVVVASESAHRPRS